MDTLLYYKEAKDGQILEEGITEAGSMSSFIAAGTAYATHGVNMIPFFIYYSMFGFQRVGDLIWAAADSRTRGFLLGGTAGRTTLAGEGLQHQDGHSHVLVAGRARTASSYDPAFAYELAVIIQDGIRRMYDEQRERLLLPDRDERAVRDAADAGGRARGHPEGHVPASGRRRSRRRSCSAQLFGSGAILPEVVKAQEILETKYGVAADVWSVTSYQELYRDGHACERWNMLHPGETPRVPYVTQCLKDAPGVLVAASDYVKALPDSIDRWLPRPLRVARHRRLRPQRGPRRAARLLRGRRTASSCVATLGALARDGKIDREVVAAGDQGPRDQSREGRIRRAPDGSDTDAYRIHTSRTGREHRRRRRRPRAGQAPATRSRRTSRSSSSRPTRRPSKCRPRRRHRSAKSGSSRATRSRSARSS